MYVADKIRTQSSFNFYGARDKFNFLFFYFPASLTLHSLILQPHYFTSNPPITTSRSLSKKTNPKINSSIASEKRSLGPEFFRSADVEGSSRHHKPKSKGKPEKLLEETVNGGHILEFLHRIKMNLQIRKKMMMVKKRIIGNFQMYQIFHIVKIQMQNRNKQR